MTKKRLAMCVWRPHYGREHNLVALLGHQLARLRELDLVTNREPVVGRTDNDEVVVILEWVSSEAIATAETDPGIVRIMRHVVALADAVTPASVPAAREMFFEMTPIDSLQVGDAKDMTLWQAANTGLPMARSSARSSQGQRP